LPLELQSGFAVIAGSILQLRSHAQPKMKVARDVFIVSALFLRFLHIAVATYNRLDFSTQRSSRWASVVVHARSLASNS
jgi:hypothetical protein